jgi:tRNA(Leu) C34 or U34 (ribose-2'-O)-methylase TrmL
LERGFAAIGLQNTKSDHNLGGALRAAFCYEAGLVIVSGNRIRHYSTDTVKAWRHVPIIKTDCLKSVCPHGAIPIAVEITDSATPLHEFEHPERGYYLFGPEDNSLSGYLQQWCKYKVYVPTRNCMNLASTVNVVLYDRQAKSLRKKSEDSRQTQRLL